MTSCKRPSHLSSAFANRETWTIVSPLTTIILVWQKKKKTSVWRDRDHYSHDNLRGHSDIVTRNVCFCVCMLTLPWELLSQLAQAAEAVGSQLAQDAGQHLCQLFGLSVARDGEGVGRQRRLNFGVVEVNHRPVIFYHIHLRERRKPHSLD